MSTEQPSSGVSTTDLQLPLLHFPAKSSYSRYEKSTNIYTFFFFCQADIVFLSNEAERNEYVLSDTGYIYVGSVYSIHGRPWNFGQVRHSPPLGLITPNSLFLCLVFV